MSKLIKIKSKEGEIFFSVRTDDDTLGMTGLVSDETVNTLDVGSSLKAIFRTGRQLSDAFAEAMKGAKDLTPALELGLSLTAGGTIYVVDAEATASVTMSFKYKEQ